MLNGAIILTKIIQVGFAPTGSPQRRGTLMVSIYKVGSCGIQTYQTVTILKQATTVELTTITPVLYMHLSGSGLF